jgi:methylated-DNA-[protein]-cysteine S-methyltransferase
MPIHDGCCRFGLWYLHVRWIGTTVLRVRFSRTGEAAPVPAPFIRYLGGRGRSFLPFSSKATTEGEPFAGIYRVVEAVPYGMVSKYGAIAEQAGTSPRVVGMAMKRNPTPLIIPCHRIVAARGIGGFTPSVEVKEALLALERRHASGKQGPG